MTETRVASSYGIIALATHEKLQVVTNRSLFIDAVVILLSALHSFTALMDSNCILPLGVSILLLGSVASALLYSHVIVVQSVHQIQVTHLDIENQIIPHAQAGSCKDGEAVCILLAGQQNCNHSWGL